MSSYDTTNIGNSGEYFVAGELERRGFTVAVPMSNVKDFDILAINRETYEQFAIQVKTTGYKQKKWTLSSKNEKLIGESIIYVFVSLNELDTPEYHIVPSQIVADTIAKYHRNWLNTQGKNGKKHNDTNIRVFLDKEDKYLDKWEYLDYQMIKGLLQDVSYKTLTDFIPKLQGIEYGELYPKKQTGDGTMEKPYQMPYMVYCDVVNEFVGAVYAFENQYPQFDLCNYISILKKQGIEWDEDAMTKADVSSLDGQVVVALVLAAVRSERFCDGELKYFLENGCIQKWLKRLVEIEKKKEVK